MKKVFTILTIMIALGFNAQISSKKEHQESVRKETQNSTPSQKGKSQNIKNNDDVLADYQQLSLSDAQKKKIKNLHYRRTEKYPKMKNTKKGLSERQYQQEVEKVLTKEQKQKFENQQKTHPKH